MPTNSFLNYCSLPLLYSLHDKFPTAVEKRWDQFGQSRNRYKDDNMDFVYETKETVWLGEVSVFHNVLFLRPTQTYSYQTTDKFDWTKNYERFTINSMGRWTQYSPHVDIIDWSDMNWSNREIWFGYPSVSQSKLLASKGRQGYSMKELIVIASYFTSTTVGLGSSRVVCPTAVWSMP